MRTTQARPRSTTNAFTMIELLVVITIIIILMGLAFPAFQAVQNSAKKTQAKNDLVQIVTAVNAFYTEYGKYPIDPTATAGDAYCGSGTGPSGVASSSTNDTLFDVLRNPSNPKNGSLVTTLNPRAIVFLNVAAVKSTARPIAGVVATAGDPNLGVWYDPWGSPYSVMLDGGYNNQLPNPYTDAPGGSPLNVGVVSWSLGKNGALGGGNAGTGFAKENGSSNTYAGSADVISWQ